MDNIFGLIQGRLGWWLVHLDLFSIYSEDVFDFVQQCLGEVKDPFGCIQY